MLIKSSILQNSFAMLFPLKIWQGFEPGSSVPLADEMTTALSRQNKVSSLQEKFALS
jgi:hypothetical protein